MSTSRRPRGTGGLNWDPTRQRWVASMTVGYDARGKRVVKRRSFTTKTEGQVWLRDAVRGRQPGVVVSDRSYTVRQAVVDWLTHGLVNVGDATRRKNRILCETHIYPALGSKKLRELRAVDVDRWLMGLTTELSSSTLRQLHSCLNRAVRQALAREFVARNVVELCQVPRGRAGRPSKSLTFSQAQGLLTLTRASPLHAYLVVGLLTGARTEELRALRWENVHLPTEDDLLLTPHVEVWRSVRQHGDTKTRGSRRTLALPSVAVDVLVSHRIRLRYLREDPVSGWMGSDLVFPTRRGTAMDAANVRREFRKALASVPGLDPKEWTPRELRHSFVSLLSDSGVSIEEISRLVGHTGTTVTELVYRHQLRPVIQQGAETMDRLFANPGSGVHSDA